MEYKKQKVKIVKKLRLRDKNGEWVQIEFVSGPQKGMRMPITTNSIK